MNDQKFQGKNFNYYISKNNQIILIHLIIAKFFHTFASYTFEGYLINLKIIRVPKVNRKYLLLFIMIYQYGFKLIGMDH